MTTTMKQHWGRLSETWHHVTRCALVVAAAAALTGAFGIAAARGEVAPPTMGIARVHGNGSPPVEQMAGDAVALAKEADGGAAAIAESTVHAPEIIVLGRSVGGVRRFFSTPYGGTQPLSDTTPPTMTDISLHNGDTVCGVETVTITGLWDDTGVVKTELVGYPLGRNLLTNGDFEMGQQGAWQKWWASWGTNYAWDFASIQPGRFGSYCLRLGGTTTSGSFGVYQQVAVEPGKTYRLDAYWRGERFVDPSWYEVLLIDGPFSMSQADDGPAATVQGNFMYAYDNNTFRLPDPVATTFGWVWGHDQYSPPPNQVDWNNRRGQRTASGNVMTVVLKAGTAGPGVVAWFDNVSLTEMGTEQAFVSATSDTLEWDVRDLVGGEYEVTVSAYDAALNEARITRTVTVGATARLGYYEPGWNLTSVPVQPYAPEASTVFGELIAAGNVVTDHLYRYDGDVGYERYPAAFSDIERGRGYWLYLSAAGEDCVPGEAAKEDVELSLDPGWNLIGYPFQQPQLLSDCRVRDGANTVSFGDAVQAGLVGATLYFWDPNGGYRISNALGYGHDDSLRPWLGYWLYARAADYALVIPVPAQ